jgi:hypothetical protein
MASIWPVSEGREHTPPAPWVDVPLSEAIALCDLRQSDFVSDFTVSPPRFGDPDRDLWYAGFKHVVVEVQESEGRKAKWKPGFYKSRISPKEVFRRLLQQPLVAALGNENVVRIEYAPGIDSQGRGAVRITVIIAPNAIQRLASGATVDALVRLRERLHEMRVDRTPIVQYATEAELAEDGGT